MEKSLDNFEQPIEKKDESPLCLCGCGKHVGEGRSHKKYFSDGHKNLHHNRLKKKNLDEIRLIDTELKKNQKILKELLDEKEFQIVTKGALQARGYNFKYHTHIFTSATGNDFCVCYNYAYRKLDNGKYKIIGESEKGSLA